MEQSTTSSPWLWTIAFRVSPVTENAFVWLKIAAPSDLLLDVVRLITVLTYLLTYLLTTRTTSDDPIPASFLICTSSSLITITRKRGNCECIATWGRPNHEPYASPFSALITTPCQVRSSWTYRFPYYSVYFLPLTHYLTPWPWPLTLWPWTLTSDLEHLQRIACDVMKLFCTKFEHKSNWTQSNNPRRRHCDFSIWSNNLKHVLRAVAFGCEIISTKFDLRQLIRCFWKFVAH